MTGAVLLLLVCTRHWWYVHVDGILGMNERAWFYVFGGVQETALWLLLMPSALALKGVSRKLALLSCAVGAAMGLLLSGCRTGLAYFGKTLKDVKDGQGVCEAWLGVDFNLQIVIAVMAAVVALTWNRHARH